MRYHDKGKKVLKGWGFHKLDRAYGRGSNKKYYRLDFYYCPECKIFIEDK